MTESDAAFRTIAEMLAIGMVCWLLVEILAFRTTLLYVSKRAKDVLVQAAVACFSVGAIATSYSKDPSVRAFSPYLGLCSQPFWFYISLKNRLWGPLLISVAYTSVFIYGLTQT